METVGRGKLKEVNSKWDIRCGWLGQHGWLPLVAPKFEMGAKFWESVEIMHQVLIASEVVVWLPGWLLQIVG